MNVDIALQHREKEGRPVRVALIGAGATGRAIALQLGTPAPGIRIAGIANRTASHAERAFREAGILEWSSSDSLSKAEASLRRGIPVLTDDPSVLIRNPLVDVVVEVTGTVDFAAQITLDAIDQRKHIVAVNAELDSTVGPILKARADEAGVVFTNTDGDEPGVAMTLFRYLRSLGLHPVAAGNIKGMVDYYRNPDTQQAFAEKTGQDVRKVTSFADATKLSMETTVLANATGFGVGQRGMFGPACANVSELATRLDSDAMLSGGIVDYALGAAPHTGGFVVVHETNPLKQQQLAYYKMGPGPFYVFYTPFHLPHLQIASTIGRAAVLGDPTVTPASGPRCEVVAVAKRDLRAGETLDGVGGYCTYGLIDNASTARAMRALPMGLSLGCTLRHDVARDVVLTAADVIMPAERLSDRLWQEQTTRWPTGETAAASRESAVHAPTLEAEAVS
ncbi:MAG TPA: SAF domain-containing protein [Vicinamibacterales bacterium]